MWLCPYILQHHITLDYYGSSQFICMSHDLFECLCFDSTTMIPDTSDSYLLRQFQAGNDTIEAEHKVHVSDVFPIMDGSSTTNDLERHRSNRTMSTRIARVIPQTWTRRCEWSFIKPSRNSNLPLANSKRPTDLLRSALTSLSLITMSSS